MNAVTPIATTTIPANPTPADLIFNDDAFARMEQVAKIMASGRCTIPAHLRGSTGDCFAILMQAARWKMDPYAVAQKTYFVTSDRGGGSGASIAYEAQLVAAVINQNAPITGRLNYEQFGPWEGVIGKSETRQNKEGKSYRVPGWKPEDEKGCGVRVWATIKGEDAPRVLPVLLSQALTRNSTLWAEDPVQQLCYLAAKRWARRHCPDVIMGVYTPDELDRPEERDITPAAPEPNPEPRVDSRTAKIRDRIRTQAKPAEPEPDWAAEASRISAGMATAATGAALDALVLDAQKLPDQYRVPLRQQYRERATELKRAAKAPAVDTKTGEIFEAAPPAEAEHADWIAALDDQPDLEAVDSLVALMPPETVEAIAADIERRRAAVGGAK